MKKAIITFALLCTVCFAQDRSKSKIAAYAYVYNGGVDKTLSKNILAHIVKNCQSCTEISNNAAFLSLSEPENGAKKYAADFLFYVLLWRSQDPYDKTSTIEEVYLKNLKTDQFIYHKKDIRMEDYESRTKYLSAILNEIQPKLAALAKASQVAKEKEYAQMDAKIALENKRRELIKSLWE